MNENVCVDCNPGMEDGKKETTSEDKRDIPSIYVGETSRSMKERALENWKDFIDKDPDSHIFKHWTLQHGGGGEGNPNFKFRIV